MKNCVIITSVIEPSNAPLSYTDKRSVYSKDERYVQTLETLESVKKYIPDTDIAIVECSPVSKMLYDLSTKADVFLNLYPNEEIRKTPNKGVAEARMLLAMLDIIEKWEYQNVFKLTGRYLLNNDFDYSLWDNKSITVKKTNHYSGPSIHTFLYKFNKDSISKLKEICDYLIISNDSAPAEQVFHKYLSDTAHISIVGNIGITARWSCYSHVDLF